MQEANKIQLLMRALARPLRSSGGSRLSDQSGQAVLEYILVLVVIVGIILGVMYQFNDAFKKYVQSYFGEYVACLLETGEMPSLGGDGGVNAESCNASFEPFSLKNGRPFNGSGGGGGNGEGANASSKTPGADGNKSLSRSRNNRLRPSKVSRNMTTRNADGSSGSGSSSSESSNNKKSISKRSSSNPTYSMRTNRLREKGQIPISSAFTTGVVKKDTKPFTATVSAIGKKAASARGRNGKLMVDPSKFRTLASKDSSLELGLSFSDYIRYIIIFGLIVMIVIFFGGQLFQLKKGWSNN